MSTRKPTDIDRLSALIDVKLADMEAKAKAGKVPSVSELNAVRRLVTWRDHERHAAEAIELGRAPREEAN